jgi:hypothetical protein
VTAIAFQSRPLPLEASGPLRTRLLDAHDAEPFSALDPRQAARRAADIAGQLGLRATVVRGGLDLDGSELDHIWLDVEGCVLDVAFPLFVPTFVRLLRGWVTGEVDSDELEAVAVAAGLEHRVLGEFPAPLQYRGQPVWAARH